MASVSYDAVIEWAGVVMVMTDGSKRAIEFRRPRHALLRIDGGLTRELYGELEITLEISGFSSRWRYGDEYEPKWPTGEIEAPVKEIERGRIST